MPRPEVVDLERFASAMAETINRGMAVPLLVLRVPEFVEIAWRKGRRAARLLERRTTAAFRDAAAGIIRGGDALGHNHDSDRFAIALLTPARAGTRAGVRKLRSSLERVVAGITVSTGRRLEAGWWPVETQAELDRLSDILDAALARGMRDRERHALLATVGHELRTPLTSIRGYIETLLEAEELDPRTTRRFLETTRREALRLGRLVEGMLEFSMLDVSSQPFDAYCDAAEQARATIDAALPLARRRDVSIRARLPRTAPARIDGDACVHALLNLVENAVKHGREGGSVCIDCGLEGKFVRVHVDDDGPGIIPEERATIFQIGVRGARTMRGCGIGLAVVRAIAERCGGEVRVSSSPLGGARFTFRVPSAQPSQEAPGPGAS
jgi:signal transduction histidine kinase